MTVALSFPACGPAPLDDLELVAEIEAFEAAIAGQPREVVQRLLRDQTSTFKGRLVTVSSAIVSSTYFRDNRSNIYFGTNYDESDHLFLSEIDPPLHDALKDHRHWVSVAATHPTRQLSFEMPIDQPTFDRLERGQEVAFSCTIAAMIRGKSVYCVPVVLDAGP